MELYERMVQLCIRILVLTLMTLYLNAARYVDII